MIGQSGVPKIEVKRATAGGVHVYFRGLGMFINLNTELAELLVFQLVRGLLLGVANDNGKAFLLSLIGLMIELVGRERLIKAIQDRFPHDLLSRDDPNGEARPRIDKPESEFIEDYIDSRIDDNNNEMRLIFSSRERENGLKSADDKMLINQGQYYAYVQIKNFIGSIFRRNSCQQEVKLNDKT